MLILLAVLCLLGFGLAQPADNTIDVHQPLAGDFPTLSCSTLDSLTSALPCFTASYPPTETNYPKKGQDLISSQGIYSNNIDPASAISSTTSSTNEESEGLSPVTLLNMIKTVLASSAIFPEINCLPLVKIRKPGRSTTYQLPPDRIAERTSYITLRPHTVTVLIAPVSLPTPTQTEAAITASTATNTPLATPADLQLMDGYPLYGCDDLEFCEIAFYWHGTPWWAEYGICGLCKWYDQNGYESLPPNTYPEHLNDSLCKKWQPPNNHYYDPCPQGSTGGWRQLDQHRIEREGGGLLTDELKAELWVEGYI